MFRHFVNLQWKAFFRSASLGKDTAVKVIMGIFAAMMLLYLGLLGVMLYFILEKAFPGADPVQKVSEYFLYWILIELFFRYFMQKLPVMNIKPFLTLPVPKSSITHFVLGKSALSFYNFMSLFLFVPFAVVLLTKGYPLWNLVFWIISILGITLTLNFVNFLINKSDKVLIALAAILISLYFLEYFSLLPVNAFAGELFYLLYQNPLFCLVPIALALLFYWLNYRFLRDKIYLDSTLKKKVKEAVTSDLAWTKKFGDIAPYLQLDLKLIWRNKRTKTQVYISLGMIFYGLIFYFADSYGATSTIYVFVGIFMTGIFLSNFGQFIPAWDSEYYSMIMAQNIPLRKYLESKAGLISVSVVVMFLLSIPYVYFGWQALAINFACAIYNLGVNIPLILYFGSMNKKRIDLDKSAIGNMQGTSATQFLVLIPLMLVPCLMYLGLKFLISFEIALAVFTILGLIGLAFRKPLMSHITEIYRAKKYDMISGFKQKIN
ncbi:DUF5687 family protein [Poritiphilus flavus]|uniref:ABC-2 type transport system permease protein n=1 Tax=Poritiphilus flavus TaxID=2697053 RepID=A0A6L9E8M3_9FLAO|nr:DUF5687 family protein [Poritiphilus flavus]NAS10953.1 hypothetical protein [Poritiphilus flavus]